MFKIKFSTLRKSMNLLVPHRHIVQSWLSLPMDVSSLTEWLGIGNSWVYLKISWITKKL